jgi:hypothetical protein
VDLTTLSDDGGTLYLGTYKVQYPNWPQVVQLDLTALPRLTDPRRTAAGSFEVGLLGRDGTTYDVQTSADLVTWKPWLTTNVTSSVRLVDPSPAPEGRRLYRVVSH